jgi:hypothetical protein
MKYSQSTSNTLYSSESRIGCITCLENIQEELKNIKDSRVHFRIKRYESEKSSKFLEEVCLHNKFSEAIRDSYSKSIQINRQHKCVFFFGLVDVLADNCQTHSCVQRIYKIEFDEIFHVEETRHTTPGMDNLIYLDILICSKETIKHIFYDRDKLWLFIT